LLTSEPVNLDEAPSSGIYGTVALRRRASSPCTKQEGKTPQAPWKTPINRTSEGLSLASGRASGAGPVSRSLNATVPFPHREAYVVDVEADGLGDAQAGVKRQQRQHPVPRCEMVSAYDLMYTGRYDLTCIGRARPIMPCSVLSFDRGELLVEHPDADQHRCPGPRPPAVTPSSALPRTVVTLSPHDGRPSVNTSRMIILDQGETPTTAGFPYESSLGDKLHRHDCSP